MSRRPQGGALRYQAGDLNDIDEDTGVLEHGVVKLGLFLVRRKQRGRL
jgi:hypothetical protein